MKLWHLIALLLALAGPATAQQWADYATVSPTSTLTNGRLCYSDGRDVACDATAPYITSGTLTTSSIGVGNLLASGYLSSTNISATFIQAGTGGTCAAGTAGGLRYNSTSNTLQICTGATGWQSITSGTAGGGTPAGSNGQIQFNNSSAFGASTGLTWTNDGTNVLNVGAASDSYGAIVINGDSNTGISPKLTLHDTPGPTDQTLDFQFSDGALYMLPDGTLYSTMALSRAGLTVSGSLAANFGTSGPPAAALAISGTSRITGWTMIGKNQAASATLHVAGEIIVSNTSLACGSTIKGGLRWESTSNTLQVCNSVGWTSLASGTTGGGGTPAAETISLTDLMDVSSTVASGNLMLGSTTGNNYAGGTVTTGSANTSLGIGALTSVTSGPNNTAVGKSALSAATYGGWNTAMGTGALMSSVGSNNNSAFGFNALNANSDSFAANNVAFGSAAATNNTNGKQMVAMGASALYTQTNGHDNTGVGYSALYRNGTGGLNTVVGSQAGYGAAASNINTSVLVGFKAGYANAGSAGNTMLGILAGQATTSGSSNTLVGGVTAKTLTTGSGNIVIGDQADVPAAAQSSWLNIGNAISGSLTGSLTTIGGIKANGVVTATYFEGDGSRLTNLPGGAPAAETISLTDLSDVSISTGPYGNFIMGPGTAPYMVDAANVYYNTAIGLRAMIDISGTVGSRNTAIGAYAMSSSTTASSNVAIGDEALRLAGAANGNVAVGTQALYSGRDGYRQVAIGYQALYNSAPGVGQLAGYNVAIGHTALSGATTGQFNIGIGYEALKGITTTNDNVAIGYRVMDRIAGTSTQNVALGTQAGYGASTSSFSNSVIIGYNAASAIATNTGGNTLVGHRATIALTTGGSNTIIGGATAKTLTTGSRNIVIGQQADVPVAAQSDWLNIGNAISGSLTGSLTTIGGIQANGVVTATYFEGDGSRLVNVSGGGGSLSETISINDLADAHTATVTGNLLMGGTVYNISNAGDGIHTGESNTGLGIEAFKNITTGVSNTALGNHALYTLGAGQSNVAIGTNALRSVDGASANTAIGDEAGFSITGYNNVAVGKQALRALTSSSYNTAVGSMALNLATGSQNTGIGASAGLYMTTGSRNTGVGYSSIMRVTTGDDNTALGNYSLSGNATGSENTAIGEKAGQGSPSQNVNRSVLVGFKAGYANAGSTGNTMLGILAGQATTSGSSNTLVGGVTAKTLTTGSGNIVIGDQADVPAAAQSSWLNIGNAISGSLLSGGTLGFIGGISSTKLAVTALASNAGTNPVCVTTSTGVFSYSTACTASDARLKKDVAALGGSLDKIMLMKPVTFHWKDAARGTGLNIGLIAQDVARVYPEIAFTGSDGLMGVDYAKLVPPLIGAVQEQQAQIKALRKANDALEQRLKAIEAKLGLPPPAPTIH